MKYSLHALAVLSLATLLLTSACGTAPENKLVGRWELEGPVESTTEFFKDGTFQVDIEGMDDPELESISGTWSMLSKDEIEIEVTVMGMTNSDRGTISFEGEDLLIEMNNGQSSRYSPAE